jgi:hypothetical protein
VFLPAHRQQKKMITMTQMLAQSHRDTGEHVSELWRGYERFARSDDPFDRTTAQMLFNAATHLDSIKRQSQSSQ